MASPIKRVFGKRPAKQVRRVTLRANYDAAQTTTGNSRWWGNSDGLSAKRANSPEVRRKLRNRSRYEVANNCYAGGIVRTWAEDCISTGPRLQLTGLSREDSKLVERLWHQWCQSVGIPDYLLTMRRARAVDGESVAIMISNPQVDHPVSLDLRLVEAEMLSAPWAATTEPVGEDWSNYDGIHFDQYGNPTHYQIMQRHPGDAAGYMTKWDKIRAADVIHDFRADRPGQVRGIPELTAALPLFSMLRGYGLAVLAAAEAIANYAMVAYTDSPGDEGADEVDPFEEIELERGILTHLPRGWKLGQPKPEQPSSTYREFKREIVAEIGRIFSMPFIVAAGDSSGSSYAAGRMDYQIYRKAVQVDRDHINRRILDRIFRKWREEAILVEGLLPQRLRSVSTDWSHSWRWDGWEHVDPAKEANAINVNLSNDVTTLAEECAKKGLDWEEQLELSARIKARRQELADQYGIDWNDKAPAAPQPEPARVVNDDDEDLDEDAQDD